jgi:hypothetical protein
MSPFTSLGLPEDADEQSIKRAYASRLRTTRPDSDPEGFQRLHAVYQSALAMCRASVPSEAVALAMPPVEETPHEPFAAPAATSGNEPRGAATSVDQATLVFDAMAFAREIIALATRDDVEALQAWLADQPILWSFRAKAIAGHALMHVLYREEPPMPASCLRSLLHFFDQDHVHAGHAPMALQRLERRMHLAWLLLPAQRDELVRRLHLSQSSPVRRGITLPGFSAPSPAKIRARIERCLRRLQRPVGWWRGIRAGLSFRSVDETHAFMTELAGTRLDDFPPSIPRESLRFWSEAGNNQRISRARLSTGIGRALLWTCLIFPLGALFALDEFTRKNQVSAMLPALIFTLSPWLVGLGWLAWRGGSQLNRWHSMPEAVPAPRPRLRLALVPALCTIGAVLAFALPSYLGLGYLFLLAGFQLSLRRCWQRNEAARVLIKPPLVWIGLFGLMSVTHSPVWVMSGWAMLAWAFDVWRQRDALRLNLKTIGR